MNKTATLLSYGRRIERVVQHIARHLDDGLDLAELAEVACFSPCHFHRVYRGVTGETVAETVRRLKLSRAAGDLVQGDAAMMAVARRAGYGSVAAFTRSFRTGYGVTPAAYRRQGRLLPPPFAHSMTEGTMYTATIRDPGPVRLAGIRHTGPYMEIGPVFERLCAWAGGRGLIDGQTRLIGIFYDAPWTVPAAQLRSDACLSLDPALGPALDPSLAPGTGADQDVRHVDLAGGRHAVVRHQGPYAELEGAYRWLFGTWLPESGEEPDDRPCFEEYLNNPRSLPPAEWLTDIFLPLKPRG